MICNLYGKVCNFFRGKICSRTKSSEVIRGSLEINGRHHVVTFDAAEFRGSESSMKNATMPPPPANL
jgi:hypothetical protein